MSGSTSVMAVGEGFRQPFTAVQWQELEHQALIYKYLAAGMPVPVDLVIPIRMSLEALSARFFHHPTFGYCSYYGKKFDPEPGRCRRTDGKKWRCSKDAHPDSKYCERHMHRGRNRSRKPVESQTNSSLTSSTTRTINGGGGTTKYQQTSGTFQNLPLISMVNSDNLEFGRNISKSDVSTVSFGISNDTNNRYINGVTTADEEKSFCSEASEIERKESGTWKLRTPQTESSTDPSQHLLQRNMHQLYKATTTVDSPVSSHQQQQNMMRSFFDEWPDKAKDSWSDLSMSVPMHSHADFPPHDA